MAYDAALMKELKKQWPKVGRKGGYFALAMNFFPKNKDAQPLLRVHPTKEMTKAALKKIGPDGTQAYAKTITGRIDASGEISFWIAADSDVKSPALLRKAVKRLAEDPEIAQLQPKFATLRRAPMAVDGDVDIDEGELVDTEQARRDGGKGKLKQALGVGDYAKLLKRLDSWKKTFHSKGITSATAPKAREALWAIHGDAQKWITENRGTDKLDRLAAVQGIMTTCAALRDKLDARLAMLAESASVDALLEGDRPMTDGEQRMAARNLQARLQNTQDPDEREELVLALKRLPNAVANDMVQVREADDQADREGRDLTRDEAGVRLETQQRAADVLMLYALGARATPLVDPRGRDERITGRDEAKVALLEHVDDMLVVPPDVHSQVLSEQVDTLAHMLETLDDEDPELAEDLADKLRAAGVEASVELALKSLADANGDVAQALKTLGRANNFGSKLLGVVRHRATKELAEQTRLVVRQELGDKDVFTAVEPESYGENGKNYNRFPEPYATVISDGVRLVVERFLDPRKLPRDVLVLAGQVYDRVAEATNPRIARQTLLDGVLLRTIVPMMAAKMDNPKTGASEVPPTLTTISAFVQNIFNRTLNNATPQFNPLIQSYWPYVDAFWVRLIDAGYEAAGIDRDPPLDGDMQAQALLSRWLDLRDALVDSDLASDADLRTFISAPQMALHPVTRAPDPLLAQCQSEAGQFLDAFETARAELGRLDLVAAFNQDAAGAKRSWDRTWFPSLNDTTGMNGLQNAVAMWHHRIVEVTASLPREEQLAWNESRQHDVWEAAQLAIGEENSRQGRIERDVNEKVFGVDVWRQD